MDRWLLRLCLFIGVVLCVAPFFLFSYAERLTDYREVVRIAISGTVSPVIGGILIIIYMWRR